MAAPQRAMADRLAKASLQTKALIMVVVLALLGGAYWNFIYSDLLAEKESLESVRKRQIEDERRLIKRKAEYQELLRQKADVEDRLRRNAIKLPETSELPALFQHLETQAATANVRILIRNTEKEVPVETYVKVPVRMEIQGDFYQINNYFKLLSETLRIITIENLFIGDPRRAADRVLLTARFTASTFRQAGEPPAPASPPPPRPSPTPAPATPPPAPRTAPAAPPGTTALPPVPVVSPGTTAPAPASGAAPAEKPPAGGLAPPPPPAPVPIEGGVK